MNAGLGSPEMETAASIWKKYEKWSGQCLFLDSRDKIIKIGVRLHTGRVRLGHQGSGRL